MTSAVALCNLALSHIGDPGFVTSIEPPDGTAQAARCAIFWPIVRRAFLQARDWSFATARADLTESGNDPVGPWLYRYVMPPTALRLSKILNPAGYSHEPTEPFIVEVDSTGVRTILTNMEAAEAVYVFDQVDLIQWGQQAVNACSWLLASYLAGPIIKGKAGVTVGQGALQRYGVELSIASAEDGLQHRIDTSDIQPSGIAARS